MGASAGRDSPRGGGLPVVARPAARRRPSCGDLFAKARQPRSRRSLLPPAKAIQRRPARCPPGSGEPPPLDAVPKGCSARTPTTISVSARNISAPPISAWPKSISAAPSSSIRATPNPGSASRPPTTGCKRFDLADRAYAQAIEIVGQTAGDHEQQGLLLHAARRLPARAPYAAEARARGCPTIPTSGTTSSCWTRSSVAASRQQAIRAVTSMPLPIALATSISSRTTVCGRDDPQYKRTARGGNAPRMFEAFKKFLSDSREGEKQSATRFEANDYRLAAAALLIHAATIDGEMSDIERDRLHAVIKLRFGLDEAAADELVDGGDRGRAARRSISIASPACSTARSTRRAGSRSSR